MESSLPAADQLFVGIVNDELPSMCGELGALRIRQADLVAEGEQGSDTAGGTGDLAATDDCRK
jgi:hypothetical protein